jgi:hypothetical protein
VRAFKYIRPWLDEGTGRLMLIGDIVDRGFTNLGTLVFVLTLKIRYGDLIIILRGNHEGDLKPSGRSFHAELYRLVRALVGRRRLERSS